ncbi:CheR family methyltransferase [Fimbriiglobus ruber]|uniref:protein-glutamate O-methyltransferase n=1 Tax=Fimbriiglobus ruber TaxID=1908690 RepID=A0A225DEB0_9BACT|nr:protein-glutamate O-methyltransferase CheR [Fimbriiglobus ruber]OWK34735.1 Chemotaxis protein methyltransferase CheR [Fimbriiglobus ruber]
MTTAGQIVGLLERRVGLSARAVGDRMIESALARRMKELGTTDADDYARRLAGDARELDCLVEAVVVAETWFYRYPESFKHLAQMAIARKPVPSPARPFRVLCAPCSTGEEPYSVAMTLFSTGLAPDAFRVDATDVSTRAVGVARAGRYGRNSFRGADPYPRDGFFTEAGDGFAIRDEVRKVVFFRTANLTDPHCLANEQPYDAIFCRNLLIYLTDAARRTVVATLDRLLAPGGVMYMGHAEPLGLIDPRFRPELPPQAFAFSRTASTIVRMAETIRRPFDGPAFLPPVTVPQIRPGPRTPAPSTKTADFPPPAPLDPVLSRARAAADAGNVAEAAAICAHVLRELGPSADALALRGIVNGMAGRPADAEADFTRALYLDPGHYDALVHMMILAQNRGDVAAAANYRRRAGRAARREEQS